VASVAAVRTLGLGFGAGFLLRLESIRSLDLAPVVSRKIDRLNNLLLGRLGRLVSETCYEVFPELVEVCAVKSVEHEDY
jgi:hypothetical protein